MISSHILAPSGNTRSPKAFQAILIANLVKALQREPRPPCLLRSPTGSGKTFMLTRVLQHISEIRPTLWLWFVPFVNLVAQTIDSLDTEGVGLKASELNIALNEEPAAGLVLLSTVQGVASAKARTSGYTSADDDERRSIASYIARARSMGLEIGLVVDEAHIALKSTTEFGKFVHWLEADDFLMASATPRDAALNQFINAAGYNGVETFSVSRADVVAARLNKQWLNAVIYDVRESMQSITDLKLTVLRRGWYRNRKIERDLKARGLSTVPLMLVQVGNGAEAIAEAHDFLMHELKIPPHAIGIHSADDPDPVMMAAIANDTTKQVLVFKQSAGTGFDAPRAFVLASTKPVNDPDFATQFIGRVMRVPPELQKTFPQSHSVPPDLDTAYIFLANAEAQSGFADAAAAMKNVQSQFSGQVEELVARRTALGGVALTNRPTEQSPLMYDLGWLNPPEEAVISRVHTAAIGITGGLFEENDDLSELDTVLPEKERSTPARRTPATKLELLAALHEVQFRTIERKMELSKTAIPNRFIREEQPPLLAFAHDVQEAARQLRIEENVQKNAVKAALNRMTEREIHTELFSGEIREEDVQVITDQESLFAHTRDILETLGLEEQDCTDVIQILAQRLIDDVEHAWNLQDEENRPTARTLRRHARQAACWVIHKQFDDVKEALHQQWAKRAKEVSAECLPDILLLPAGVNVQASRKNIYGILFPQSGETAAARDALPAQSQQWWKQLKNETYALSEPVHIACIDATYEFNESELAFAKALDRADFVQWWHRNPQGKSSSVALLRGDSKNLFYPDFVVCMTHVTGDAPLLRLIDPKHDTKDAARKSIHHSVTYGKVLFLTQDAKRVRIVNDDGSVGDVVDLDDLNRLRQWMRQTQPLTPPVLATPSE